MDLVLPDVAEFVWLVVGFVVLALPVVVIASFAVAAMRRARSRDAEVQRLRERVDALEHRESSTVD